MFRFSYAQLYYSDVILDDPEPKNRIDGIW